MVEFCLEIVEFSSEDTRKRHSLLYEFVKQLTFNLDTLFKPKYMNIYLIRNCMLHRKHHKQQIPIFVDST